MKAKSVFLGLGIFVVSCGSDSSGIATSSSLSIRGSGSQIEAVNSAEFLPATSGINPDLVELKVFKVAVSSNEDCSNLTTVFSEDDPEYIDFLNSPNIGTGSVANGTYPCVVIEVSDNIRFSPAESSDNAPNGCVAETTYTMDVCQDRGESSDDTSVLVDGTNVTCDDTENRVAIYLSTLSTQLPRDPGDNSDPEDEGNPFTAPSSESTSDGFLLDGALEVSGNTTTEFIADFTGRVAEEEFQEDGDCGMESPNWGFKAVSQ